MKDLTNPKTSLHKKAQSPVNGDTSSITSSRHSDHSVRYNGQAYSLVKQPLNGILRKRASSRIADSVANGGSSLANGHHTNGNTSEDCFIAPLNQSNLRLLNRQKKGGREFSVEKNSLGSSLRERMKRSLAHPLEETESVGTLMEGSSLSSFQDYDLSSNKRRGSRLMKNHQPLDILSTSRRRHYLRAAATLSDSYQSSNRSREGGSSLSSYPCQLSGYRHVMTFSSEEDSSDSFSSFGGSSVRLAVKKRKATAKVKSVPSKNYKKPKLDDSATTKYLCSCVSFTKINSVKDRNKKDRGCCAVDSVDEISIPCSRSARVMVADDTNCRMEYQWLCLEHHMRQQRHIVCPACKEFCCRGSFQRCWSLANTQREVHYFHRNCYPNLAACPHCETSNITEASLNYRPSPAGSKESQKESSQLPQLEQNWNPLDMTMADLDRIRQIYQTPVPVAKFLEPRFLNVLKRGNLEESLMYVKVSSPNYKFKINEDSPLHIAAAYDHLELAFMLCELGAQKDAVNKDLLTPLMVALHMQSWRTASFLCWQPNVGIDKLNGTKMSVLHMAAQFGTPVRLLEELLRRCSHINGQDQGLWTPLMWAVEKKYTHVVKSLLGHGASTTITDKEKNTALHWAAYFGHPEIVTLLLENGDNPNVTNALKETPLHLAVAKDKMECAMVLLAFKSNIYIKNLRGLVPLQMAKSKSACSHILYLREIEAKKLGISAKMQAEKILTSDISKGKEKVAIAVVNSVDEEGIPTDFCYITANCETVAQNIDRTITSLESCRCDKQGSCLSGRSCRCAALSRNCWYDPETGRLLDTISLLNPPLLYECNHTCHCDLNRCPNRVVQHGIQCHLQIFRTPRKGWGVRSLAPLPRGTFICEYIGDIISDKDADRREDDSYLFDLESKDGEVFCLDARAYGNVSRFINHHCEPNLVPVKVLIEHHDITAPHIALFATRDIQAMEELGFDYGAKFWGVKSKYFSCECGFPQCRYPGRT